MQLKAESMAQSQEQQMRLQNSMDQVARSYALHAALGRRAMAVTPPTCYCTAAGKPCSRAGDGSDPHPSGVQSRVDRAARLGDGGVVV